MKNYKKLTVLLQNFADLLLTCEGDIAKEGALTVLFSDIYNLVIDEKLEFLKDLKPFLTDEAHTINRRILTATFRRKLNRGEDEK